MKFIQITHSPSNLHIFFSFYRAPNCPQCREENPSSHKIFLILNDEPEVSPSAPSIDFGEELQVKLESSFDKIFELEEQLKENEINFLQMQEQYSVEQELRKKLQREIDQVAITDEYFLQMHSLYSASEDRVKTLQEEILRYITELDLKSQEIKKKENEILTLNASLHSTDKRRADESELAQQMQQKLSEHENKMRDLQQENSRLANQNEYHIKELALKAKEISVLKEFLDRKVGNSVKTVAPTPVSETVTACKCNADTVADLKVKHLTLQLEKEIENNSKLLLEKKKLQSQIQEMEKS